MNDDLDDLRKMMDAATPRPDPARRAENLALAQKNFDTLQGSDNAPRPTSVTGPMALWTGVKTMLNTMTSKGGLTATTALVACGFLFLTPVGQDMWRDAPIGGTTTETGKIAAPTPPIETDVAAAESTVIEESTLTEPTQATRGRSDSVTIADETPDGAGIVDNLADAATTGQTLQRTLQQAEQAPNAIVAAPQRVAPPSPTPSATAPLEGAMDMQTVELRPGTLGEPGYTPPESDTETFANATQNPLKIVADEPVSTFSIDVDTAAYAVVRSSLMAGQLPPESAVRVEELINYFPYDYPAPGADAAPFRPTVTVMGTPWNADTQLVHIALQGQMPAIADRPPLNLVFLIDTSGSMDDPTKLPLLRQSFMLMLDQLRPEDEVAIVEYAGSSGLALAPTPASERGAITWALMQLGAGGGTNGQGGLEQAYAVADDMAADGEVNRVILATDGDFNVGMSDPNALKDFIAEKRETGTYLSVLGFGRGNLDDATMQALAQNGNGTAAYIDTLSEAQKVLVDQLTGALFPIAGDVKVQVEFNPAQIAEYRLIGYETRALNREDFNNDSVDAGELGAGHSVTAIYEVTPVGSPAQMTTPLRYGEAAADAAPATIDPNAAELGFLKLRYKEPGESVSKLIETPIAPGGEVGTEQQFAVAVAGFGQLLRDNDRLGDWGYDDAIALANANRGDDEYGYRTSAVQLMRLAQSLSTR